LKNKYLILLLLSLFPLFLTWTFDHSLWNPDETRDAGIAREMYVGGDYVVPHLNGRAFLEKPPLYYWSCAAVYKLTGRITAGTTRLPAALYGFLAALLTFLIGARFFNERVGLMAAVMLGTGAQFFHMSHFALMDTSLAALITAALFCYMNRYYFLFVAFSVLAFYTKGFVAFALIGVVAGGDLLIKKEFKTFIALVVGGGVAAAALIAPWAYELWKAGGAANLRVFFIENNFLRFFSGKADHQEPFYYYLGSFLADFLPWTFVFLGALWSWWKNRGSQDTTPQKKFLWIWFAAMFLFLSLSRSKRSMYLLPAFPAAALLSALWLDEFRQGRHVKTFFVASIVWALVIAGADALFVGRLDADKSFLPVIDAVNQNGGREMLIGYQFSEMEAGVFSFYLEGNIKSFEDTASLATYLDTNKEKRVSLLTSGNKLAELGPVLQNRMEVIFKFRPDKKTRAYCLYSTQ